MEGCDNRRTAYRTARNTRVELKNQSGFLLNVSKGGARLLLKEPLRSRQPVAFLVQQQDRTVALVGEPVWSRSQGAHHTVGLRFAPDQSEVYHLGLPRESE